MRPLTASDWVLHTLAGGGALLLVAWAAACRTAQPARRQRLGEWGLLAALLVGVLTLAPAWLPLPLLATAPAPPPTVAAAPAPAAPDENPRAHVAPASEPPGGGAAWEPPTTVEVLPGAPAAVAPPVVREEVPAAPSATPADPPPAPTGVSIPGRAAVLAAAYAAGAALLLLRWLLGYAALRRLLRAARPAPAALAEESAGTPGERRPRVLVSDRASVPFSCGLLRPTVVLPAALAAGGPSPALRWVLAHERAHLDRGDARACLLLGLAQAVFYPLPWFWWLRRQVRLCQEYVADAAATAAGGLPEDYAQFLLGWTAGPALPAGVTGVLGHSSDLYRRVTMLLQSPAPVERRCPRRWSLAAAAGLFIAAVVAAGLGRPASAAGDLDKKPVDVDKKPADLDKKEAPKDRPRTEPKRTPADVNRELERMLRQGNLQPDDIQKLLNDVLNDKDLRQLMQEQPQMLRQMEQFQQMQRMMQGMRAGGAPVPAMMGGRFGGGDGRLGARVAKPNPTLVDQLDLPKGQGLVLEDVQADSAAAKAGLKPHDVLLELDGKPVSDEPAKFVRELGEIKADKAVDAVVLRRGKRETVKGLKLPEAQAFGAGLPGGNFPGFPQPGAVPGFPGAPGGFGGPAVVPPQIQPRFPGRALDEEFTARGGRGVLTTTVRTDDRFTTRHEEGSLIITLTGKVADGKAAVSTITVQDGREKKEYKSVDKVPEQYRDKVKSLVEQAEQNKVRIDIKSK